MNKVILVGNVGGNPQTKQLQSDQSVISFSLATSESYKDKNGERQTKTEWHNIVLWNRPYLEKFIVKGTKLLIEGKIETRKYEDKEGQERKVTEIKAYGVELLSKQDGAEISNSSNSKTENYSDQEEDLPF